MMMCVTDGVKLFPITSDAVSWDWTNMMVSKRKKFKSVKNPLQYIKYGEGFEAEVHRGIICRGRCRDGGRYYHVYKQSARKYLLPLPLFIANMQTRHAMRVSPA